MLMLRLVVVITDFEPIRSKRKIICFDQDEDAWENALPDDRFILIQENFRFIKDFAFSWR
jgi:hypothetical protein